MSSHFLWAEMVAVALVAMAAWLLSAPAAPVRLRHRGPRRTGHRRWRRARARLGAARSGRTGVPLGALLVEAAARMRTGADAQSAWRETLIDEPGAPASLPELAAQSRSATRTDAIAGAQAAVDVAERIGAPVADVLECCAQGLSEAEEAASQRRTALAAPKATARLLTWLPVVGLALGMALGVDPIAVFTDGGAGTACFVLAAALTWVGRRWSRTLVQHAERAGR